MEQIKSKAKDLGKKVVLPETEDTRVIEAAAQLIKEGTVKVILVGAADEIKASAEKLGVCVEGAEILNPKEYAQMDDFVQELFKLREKKGMTLEKAKKILEHDNLYFGAMLVRKGYAAGMAAGSNSPTADVLRAAIHVVGTKPGLKTVSSSMIMITNTPEYGENGVLIFGDCGVIPKPTSEQLADIAISSAEKARNLADIKEPKVAMLSFSTYGSASSEDVTRVQEAVEILKSRNVDFKFSGELQFDAAVVPEVSSKKAPDSEVKGEANVLIFPDLGAGNIGYKITQRLAKAEALGPLIQGLAKPVHDLSRGCSVQDIVNVAAITAVESEL
ncbi:MAG: phosphate acetyltransferase [Fusobacteriales bacterium]|jgi:phosphate acetyltransferase|nr:phosphate acetyltransferase [Fusobacteriales bacterium]